MTFCVNYGARFDFAADLCGKNSSAGIYFFKSGSHVSALVSERVREREMKCVRACVFLGCSDEEDEKMSM